MTRTLVLLAPIAAGFLVVGLGAPARADDPGGRTTVLPSSDSPLVALRVIVPAGSQSDPKGKEGLAALTAALVAQGGTKEFTYEQILRKFYPMAGALDARCLKEHAVFSGVIHRDNLRAYADLVAAMLTEPRFAPEDFERLKNRALDYLTKTLRGNDDEELGKQVMQLAIYGADHPYGHVGSGTVEGLNSITLDDVRAFHRAHYTRGALRLGVAGGADAAFADGFRKALDRLEPGEPKAPSLPSVRPPDGLRVTIIQKPADATAISIGFPIDVNRGDDDFYALYLANSFLGEHRTFNGRLMQHLRRDRGLNYGDYSYAEEFIQAGGSNLPIPNNARRQQYFSIWIRPVPHDKAAFALRAALFELDRLVKEGMSPDDFEATRTFLLNYSNLWTQTLERRLGYAMEGRIYGRDSLVDEIQRRLPKLTVEDVNAAVRKHLKVSGMDVAIVTQDAQGLAALLKSGQPTPIAYDTAGTPERVLAEDKVIERFPLGDVTVRILPASDLFDTPGLPQPEPAATHAAKEDTAYYRDSPAQMRAPDGTLKAGTQLARLEERGSYSRVRFRPEPGAAAIEAWVASDVLGPLR
jgi:zinc protease